MSEYNFFDKRQLSELSITIISFIMIFLAIVLMLFSAITLLSDKQRIDTDLVRADASSFCKQQFENRHFEVLSANDRLVVSFKSLQDTKRVLTSFNQVYNRCDHFNLISFCYGLGGDDDNKCNNEGLFAILEFQAPLEYSRESN